MGCDHDPQFDDFIRTIRLSELCTAASSCRGGLSCDLGEHTIGGFNVVYELIFSDKIVWMARIPLPYNCYHTEDVSASYAATLKYLKKHSTIPVPTVFACCLQPDPDNKVNATYILMEKLPGHLLPTLEQEDLVPDQNDLDLATNVHQQLTDIILELASFKFSHIGSLREDPDGEFIVGPYVDPSGTAYPKHKAAVYNALGSCHKGPFSSVSDWYNAMAELNRKFALEDPEEEGDRDVTVAEYELLAELSMDIVVEEFQTGPFVINHNDLTVQNILVDDEFNITGILDFPGTIVPLASLCVFPWLFSDNLAGLVTKRDAYRDVFVNRECQYSSSALQSCEIRRGLMESATNRQEFEIGFLGPYTSIVLPGLFEKIKKRPFDPDVDYQRVSVTREWFKELAGNDGLYSWQKSTL